MTEWQILSSAFEAVELHPLSPCKIIGKFRTPWSFSKIRPEEVAFSVQPTLNKTAYLLIQSEKLSPNILVGKWGKCSTEKWPQ
jgi:hypothetical protein